MRDVGGDARVYVVFGRVADVLSDPGEVHHGVARGRPARASARSRPRRTPLHVAAACNDEPAIIRALLENGADLDAQANDGKTPCDLAVERGASTEICAPLGYPS